MEISLLVVCHIYSFDWARILKGTAAETFWMDLVVRNPLDVELNLANFTLIVRHMNGSQPDDESHPLVDVDVIEDILLSPRESRIVGLITVCFG